MASVLLFIHCFNMLGDQFWKPEEQNSALQPFLHHRASPTSQMIVSFTLASSLVVTGWCVRISSFCSWWHGVVDGPVETR
jgi:F0F1-type ATP synthase membrane subunit a